MNWWESFLRGIWASAKHSRCATGYLDRMGFRSERYLVLSMSATKINVTLILLEYISLGSTSTVNPEQHFLDTLYRTQQALRQTLTQIQRMQSQCRISINNVNISHSSSLRKSQCSWNRTIGDQLTVPPGTWSFVSSSFLREASGTEVLIQWNDTQVRDLSNTRKGRLRTCAFRGFRWYYQHESTGSTTLKTFFRPLAIELLIPQNVTRCNNLLDTSDSPKT